MQPPRANAFGSERSGLDAFLFADVGIEANGSTLTVVSILARLDKDPWAQAASWTALPKAAVIDALAESIARMPLAPPALARARDIAARLVTLLPDKPPGLLKGSLADANKAPPRWVLAAFYVAIAIGMAFSALMIPKLSSDDAAGVERSTATPEASRKADVSPPLKGAAEAGSAQRPAAR